MFDIAWSELLLVGVICLFVFGPEDIPKLMYNFGRIIRRFRYLRFALSSQFEDFMQKAETSVKTPANTAPKIPTRDTHEFDETDADEYLMDMLPPPENMPERPVVLDDEPTDDTATKPAPAADRG